MQRNDTAVAPEVQGRDVPAQSYTVLALWHLVSLDAPCVAALWTLLFARVFHVSLAWTAPLALGLAVWMFYAADRLADATAGNAHEERHHFHRRHRRVFAACWLMAAPCLLVLVIHLPHALRDGWLLLALPLAAYAGAVHAFRLSHVPKEPLIAFFFATAAIMPLLSAGLAMSRIAPAAALFGMLCWLNCAAIAAWESSGKGYVDPLTRLLGQRFLLSAATGVLLSTYLALRHGPSRTVGIAGSTSLVLLLILQQYRGRLDRTHVRALADAALLTPLIFWPLLAWHSR